ncbi:MAG: phosphopantetheine-binding protein, partial [Lentisphaerota bacterium]
PIVVGDGVWIAARATIGPGVEIGAGSMVSSAAAVMKSVPANSLVSGVPGMVIMQMASGTAASSHLPAPATAPADISGREGVSAAPEPSGTETRRDGTMTKVEFYAELEFLLKLDPGSIHGTESLLDDLDGWDSLAALEFIAMADKNLHTVLNAPALEACRTVSDLVNLFPGRIT